MILCDYDFVVFDCDGVILKSNQLKSDAFAKALEGEPERQIFEFVEYHKANGGISRYKKFAHYFNEMYPRPDADAAVEQALGKYAAIVKQGLMECELIGGVHAALSALQAAQIPCAVNSGGDEQELLQVFAEMAVIIIPIRFIAKAHRIVCQVLHRFTNAEYLQCFLAA